jgi:ABC-type nitrate/sulfonate/bicarbonate transport system ATPase subunit
MQLPPHSIGLIYGRSGSGKTTLLQLLAGLREETSGSVSMTRVGSALLPYAHLLLRGLSGPHHDKCGVLRHVVRHDSLKHD